MPKRGTRSATVAELSTCHRPNADEMNGAAVRLVMLAAAMLSEAGHLSVLNDTVVREAMASSRLTIINGV